MKSKLLHRNGFVYVLFLLVMYASGGAQDVTSPVATLIEPGSKPALSAPFEKTPGKTPSLKKRIPVPTPQLPPEKVILCVVDNRRLTRAQVLRILSRMIKEKNTSTEYNDRLRLVYTRNIIKEWLERNLLAAEAEREGISVTNEEIAKQEQALKQTSGINVDVNSTLTKIGESKEEYLRQMRDAIMGEKLIKSHISTYYTEDALRAIYDNNPAAFQRPPRVRVNHVFCPLTGNETSSGKKARRAFMEMARKEAKNGADLSKVAESADPSFNAIGGDMGWFYPDNRLPRPINELVFKLGKVGEVSGVEETEYGYYVIRLEEKQPLMGKTYEEAREVVMDAVFEQVRQKVLDSSMKNHKVIINISGIPEDKLK